jgi:hypothetical protein
MYPNDKVSLKWRVWFGIVLIVAIFGNIGSQNLGSPIHELKNGIERLEGKIGQLEYMLEEQARIIEALRQNMQKANPPKEAITKSRLPMTRPMRVLLPV